jgi:hypothetical protein
VTQPSSAIAPRNRLLRLGIAAATLLVLWLAVQHYRTWRQRFHQLTELAESVGVAGRRPGLIEGMRRDAGPTRAALRLARALLADELDQRWILDLPPEEQPEERRRGLERLDLAYRLGVESLAERPGSWEARLVLGGAEYLRRSRRHDPRLMQDKAQWLEPLREAHRLAPVQPEPLRLLAATDLGNWSVLSADERTEAIARLKLAFEDPTTFDLLSAAWLRVAPSLRQALEIVPDQPAAWTTLMRYFARQGDWERYCDARQRAGAARQEFFAQRLEDGASRLRWGDYRHGVERLLWVASQAEPDGANVAVMEEALARIPPGTGGEASARWTAAWLDWALERCTGPDGCPLSRDSLLRLVSLSRDLAPPVRARALAAAGALRDAEGVERDYEKATGIDVTGLPEWTPYVMLEARLLAERGETLEARRRIQAVPLVGRDSIRYWEAHREAARAAGDELQVATAEAWLATQARRQWSPGAWATERSRSTLEMVPAAAGTGLRLRLVSSGVDTGVWVVVWDGSVVTAVPAVDGRVLDLEVPVPERRHVVEIRAEEGAPTATAEARLLLPSP